jgi:uncharacterized RDD family membrane protein YckC
MSRPQFSDEHNPYAAPEAEILPKRPGFTPQFSGMVEYAGFWRRFAASFIDGILLGIVGGVLGFVAGIAMVSNGVDPTQPGPQLLLNLVSLVIGICYYAGMESSSSQATLGKMALGIKVTDLNGRRISVGQAVGRYLGKILSALILLIGFIMAAFTERKQALHDMMAGTLVVTSR